MIATIPVLAVGASLGLLFLAACLMAVVAWCFLCFKVGIWMAGGCRTAPAYSNVNWCRAAHRPGAPVAGPVAPAGGKPGKRRHDRPSSVVGTMLVLLLVCLAVFGIKSHRKHHAFAGHGPADKVLGKDGGDGKVRSEELSGRGRTEKDAEQLAIEKAYGWVANYVQTKLPEPRWTPSSDYVARRLVKEKTTNEREFGELGVAKQVTVVVELTPADQREFLRRGRMFFLLKLVGALVLILATISVYLRLDDLGKGYYTGWLRLGTAAIVAGVLIGLLSTFGVFAAPVADTTPTSTFTMTPVISVAFVGAVVYLSLQLVGRKS